MIISPNGVRMVIAGGIAPVVLDGSANSLEIESLAEFAVEDHNKKENAMLGFGKVVSAKQQVVAGIMYYITLVAKDGDKDKVYETKVSAAMDELQASSGV